MACNLSFDILLLIFHKLPIRSIIKCSFVCKYWQSIIKDPTFITTALNNNLLSIQNNYHNKQLLLVCFGFKQREYSIYVDRDGKFEEYLKLNPPLKSRDMSYEYDLLGTSDGVVCLVDSTDYYAFGWYCHPYILWNPLIQKYAIVPIRSVCKGYKVVKVMVGFAFDRCNNDYKLLRFLKVVDRNRKAHAMIDLFSVRKGCWRSVSSYLADDIELEWCRSLYSVNGVVYCDGFRKSRHYDHVVLEFDVVEEVFHEIDLPCKRRDGYTFKLDLENKNKEAQKEPWLMNSYLESLVLFDIGLDSEDCANKLTLRKGKKREDCSNKLALRKGKKRAFYE